MVAKTFQGLEEVLADELSALGAEAIQVGRRMVSFEGDLRLMYSANLCCRTALRILKPLYKFEASNPDELYDAVREIEWETLLTPEKTFAIDSTVNSSEFTHSKFVTYRVKDGIADHFSDRYGRRPSIRLQGADIQLNVHIFENQVTISLDSSGEPLSRRGYRQHQTEAPINEALAAGIILLTGWRGDSAFCDPMCGSGTFLIEAALIAANINPGIFRQHFAFETWPDFDADLFEELYNDDSRERPAAHKIYGADIDPEAVAIARQNIKTAGVDHMIDLVCRDFADCEAPEEPEGVLVTNPPYGERLRPQAIENLYHTIGSTLKNNFKGWHAWILAYQKEHFNQIGMKDSMKIPILNGALECQLREYVMFDGKFSDFRASGGSIHNNSEEDTPHYERVKHDHRDFKRDFKRDDRKRTDKHNDRKRGGNIHENATRDFKRDDRKRDFNRDFKRDDRSEFKNKGPKYKTREIKDKGPRISEENATVFIPQNIRPRKGWKKNNTSSES